MFKMATNCDLQTTEKKTPVILGFIEEVDKHLLRSHYFSSKIGGRPAWLSLMNLPPARLLVCGVCGKQCSFLIQVYAPVDSNNYSFHRTIFIFICRDPSCCQINANKNFKLFRSQLPKVNDFYSVTPPESSLDDAPSASYPSASRYQNLCAVCGLAGSKCCSRCHKVNYCSKEHQTIDWKKRHKDACGNANDISSVEEVLPGIHFPEYEIVNEPENIADEQSNQKSDEEKMKDYEALMSSSLDRLATSDMSNEELEKSATKETKDDKQFLKFKKRISQDPDQVLRYRRGGEPLWISSVKIPATRDIPDCECGALRQFEFQVLPQLLNHLDVDSLGTSIDWGTLVVYTCRNSCDIGTTYREEFLWKQDVV